MLEDSLIKEIRDCDEIKNLWITAKSKKLIGIDWGEKRIGLAISDQRGKIASSLTTVTQGRLKRVKKKYVNNVIVEPNKAVKSLDELKKESLDEVISSINKEDPIGIIIGLPVNMDGSFGFQCKNVLNFAENLKDLIKSPIAFIDERLSSLAVEKSMIFGGLTRAKRSGIIDKTAAAYFLQGVIDYLNGQAAD